MDNESSDLYVYHSLGATHSLDSVSRVWANRPVTLA